MKRLLAVIVIWLCALVSNGCANQTSHQTLDIYFLDMVGGGSTLIVTPLGESVLIDTGSLEPEHRDADRILRACECADLKQIDYLVTTHFHSDHFGGILEVSKRIPVKCFMDKGAPPPENERNGKLFKTLESLYQKATNGNTMMLRPGDDIPLKKDPAGKVASMTLHCVAADKRIEGFDGDVDAPVDGFMIREPDLSDNARSIALVLKYGRFEFFAGGDITWNVEHHLAHPVNRIGKVDLYQVTHHGLDQSNNPVLLKALSPTVCVAMNGPKKGIQPNAFAALRSLPSVEAIYQIHYNTLYGDDGNTDAELIANKENLDKGEPIKVAVDEKKGIFTVSIGVNGPKQTYKIR